MRKKFEVIQGGGNATPEIGSKFEKGTETIILPNCRVIHETPKAWLILPATYGEETKNAIWVPKSVCVLHTQAARKDWHDVEIIKHFADKNGIFYD